MLVGFTRSVLRRSSWAFNQTVVRTHHESWVLRSQHGHVLVVPKGRWRCSEHLIRQNERPYSADGYAGTVDNVAYENFNQRVERTLRGGGYFCSFFAASGLRVGYFPDPHGSRFAYETRCTKSDNDTVASRTMTGADQLFLAPQTVKWQPINPRLLWFLRRRDFC
jgi:hypothetical protein